MTNFSSITIFKNGTLEDARLYGDGYDFQVTVENHAFLAEVKGIRAAKGTFRLTENEYCKAKEYEKDYIVTVVLNLDEEPKFLTIDNPLKNLCFEERIINSKAAKEYHLREPVC
ncbi:MAG: DUF3883 domain-containing protein [Treponemataceae bacterium]